MKEIASSEWHLDAEHWPALLVRVRQETDNGYVAFRQILTPRFAVVWRDIALGYAALALAVWLTSVVSGWLAGAIAAFGGAIAVGAGVAYLQLFIHEAAHFNLASAKPKSDRLANVFIAWQVGTSIAAYRRIHFDHHRHLGHEGDGERSYAYRLSWRFVAEMLTGVHALRVFISRARAKTTVEGKSSVEKSAVPSLLRGVAVHAALLGFLAWQGAWASVAAWVLGVGVIFPLFATIRPLLEHRPTGTDAQILPGSGDAVTRLFDDGILAQIVGGAGFNRHLLHHWEPQISYTRLADLDRYLARTSIGKIMEARRTTYVRAFLDILEHDRDR